MVQKYYLSFTPTVIIFLAIAVPIFFVLIFISTDYFPIFAALLAILILILGKKINFVGLELSEHGMKISPLMWIGDLSFKLSRNTLSFVRWDEIQGMINFDYTYGRQKTKIYKIIFKKPDGNLTSLALTPSNLKNSVELFDNLRNKIPEITQNHKIFSDVLNNFVSPARLQCKNITLTDEGILHSKGVIPWNNLKVIYYDEFFNRISGYGTVNITYQYQKDYFENIKVAPAGTEHFRKFLQYLINKADKASIDPSILKIFDSSYKKKSTIIKWFVIFLVGYLILSFGYFIYIVFIKYPIAPK